MADVFLSYAREDRTRAAQVAQGLEALGLDVFWDAEIPPGQTWSDYTQSKLAAAKVMVVLWSEASVTSQWVREEARIARDQGKLVPASLDGAMAPFGFGEVQSADLSQWRGERQHPQWTRFLSGVTHFTGQPQNPPRSQPFAPLNIADGPSSGNMSPLDYVKKCFRHYIDAKGRARRAEYWWWIAFVFALTFVAGVLDIVLFGMNPYTNAPNAQALGGLVGLAVLAPGVCVGVRRFHDVGLSGWLFGGGLAGVFVAAFISGFAELIGGLLFLVVCAGLIVVLALPGQQGPNAYGPDPKQG